LAVAVFGHSQGSDRALSKDDDEHDRAWVGQMALSSKKTRGKSNRMIMRASSSCQCQRHAHTAAARVGELDGGKERRNDTRKPCVRDSCFHRSRPEVPAAGSTHRARRQHGSFPRAGTSSGSCGLVDCAMAHRAFPRPSPSNVSTASSQPRQQGVGKAMGKKGFFPLFHLPPRVQGYRNASCVRAGLDVYRPTRPVFIVSSSRSGP
jgi:hypothetical protein